MFWKRHIPPSVSPPSNHQALIVAGFLGALSLLEIAAHARKDGFSVAACWLWILLGVAVVGWLLATSVRVAWEDLRSGRLWFLLPIVLGVPLCFFNAGGFGGLNSESLSELQHAFERLRQPDLGYTDVFWSVYPSRSFLPNLLPTLTAGVSPLAYRIGFSLPIYLGLLFFQTGLRRYHDDHPLSAAFAALGTTAILTYPFVCSVARTFEMAVSSLAYGLWAMGALMLFAHRPSIASAAAAAWTTGLLASSFTSGLALVALLWFCLFMFLLHAVQCRNRGLQWMVGGTLLYVTVVGAGMYLVRDSPLRPKAISLEEMSHSFRQAIEMVLSIDQSVLGNVFTPAVLVFPTIAAVGYALSLRGGPLPLVGVLWCVGVIWSSVNMHGKIGPQLPFVLYRTIVIVPVVVYCVVHLGVHLSASRETARGLWRGMLLASAVALAASAIDSYRRFGVFQAPRPPLSAEVVIQDLLRDLPELGLTPFTDAVLVERTAMHDLSRIQALSWYFLPGWTRADPSERLFLYDPVRRRPGVVFALPTDPLAAETPPGYTVKLAPVSVPLSPGRSIDLLRLVFTPTGEGTATRPKD